MCGGSSWCWAWRSRHTSPPADCGGRSVPQPLVVIAALSLYLVTTWLCIFWEPRRTAPPEADSPSTAPLTGGSRTALSCRGPACSPSRARHRAERHRGRRGRRLPHCAVRHVVPRRYRRAHDHRDGAPASVDRVERHRRSRGRVDGVDGAGRMLSRSGSSAPSCGSSATQLMLRSMDRAARDTAQLAQLQRAASAWQASQSGRQRERRIQVQRALAVAGPVLDPHVASGGSLDEEERTRGAPRGGAPARRDARSATARRRRRTQSWNALGAAARTSRCSTRAASTDLGRGDSRHHPHAAGRDAARGAVGPPVHPHLAARAGRGDRGGPVERRAGAVGRGRRRPVARDRPPRRSRRSPAAQPDAESSRSPSRRGRGAGAGSGVGRRRGAAKPPAPHLADSYPKTVRVAEPGLSTNGEQVGRTHNAFQLLQYRGRSTVASVGISGDICGARLPVAGSPPEASPSEVSPERCA